MAIKELNMVPVAEAHRVAPSWHKVREFKLIIASPRSNNKMFGRRWSCCTSYLDNRMFWPVVKTGCGCLMFWVLRRLICPLYLGKRAFCLPLLSGLKYIKATRNKHEADWYSLECPPDSIFSLSSIFSSIHAPPFKHGPGKSAEPRQMVPWTLGHEHR